MKFGNINLQGIGELQNANIQNLSSAPTTNLKKGRIYFDTTDNTLYVYDGTKWVDALSQGIIYTEGTGIIIDGTAISIDDEVVALKEDLEDYIPLSLKGANNGVATLDSTGKVPTSQLPSYVDDVVETYIVGSTPLASDWLSETSGGSPLTPETGKIYVIVQSGEYLNKQYRWGGTTYVSMGDISNATESTAGIIQIATQSEINTGTNDTKAVTPLKLATLVSGMVKQYSTNNSALTQSGGVCTWTVTHNLNNSNVNVSVYEVSSGDKVMYDTTVTSANVVTIKILSSSNISANTYKVVVQG